MGSLQTFQSKVGLMASIFSLGFKSHLFPQNALRGATSWTAVLKTVLIVPVAKEAVRVEVMLKMSPVQKTSLRSRATGWAPDLIHDDLIALIVTKADRAWISFDFTHINRVNCIEIPRKLAVGLRKGVEFADAIFLDLISWVDHEVDFPPQSTIAPVHKQAVVKYLSSVEPNSASWGLTVALRYLTQCLAGISGSMPNL
jgi:hypothetical protein